MIGRPRLQLSGQKFGGLEVIDYVGRDHISGNGIWKCKCVCNVICEVRADVLRRKKNPQDSCGCLGRARHIQAIKTHGMTAGPEFNAYHGARNRCQNPNDRKWKDYGGRGIEFRFESFEQFIQEIGLRPSALYSIDRKENDGHYEPGNVRWATAAEQNKNRRNRGRQMNTVILAGHVGANAVLRYTPQGKAVADFSLAVDQGKDGNGEKRQPVWCKCVLWEKKAEALAQYVTTGKMVVVSGPVSTEAWIDKQTGAAKSKVVCTVREFTFCGGPKADDASESQAQPPAPAAYDPRNAGPITDDDIPF